MAFGSAGIAIDNSGDILVGALGLGICRIQPTTGQQTIVASGWPFVYPKGVAVEADGQILVADFGAFTHLDPQGTSTHSGAIFRVKPNSGAKTVLLRGWKFHGEEFHVAGFVEVMP